MNKKKQKNRRLATFLGTLMIIVTFVVRDVVREEARDKLTKLQNAEAVFLSRSDNSFTMIKVVDLTSDVVGFIRAYDDEREAKHLSFFWDPVIPPPGLIEIEDGLVVADGAVLQNLESLLRSILPTSIPEEEEYAKLKVRYSALVARVKKQIPADRSKATYATPELMKEIKSFEVEALDLREKALDLARRAFNRVGDVESSLEESLKRTNYIFYFIFAIGVFVNLWGSLAGLRLENG